MNKITSLLRQIMIIFLVGITVLLFQAFSYSNTLQAQAESVTPEAKSYQVNRNNTNIEDNKLKNNLKETVDNVRGKSNIYKGDSDKKDLVNSVQEKTEELVKPITKKD